MTHATNHPGRQVRVLVPLTLLIVGTALGACTGGGPAPAARTTPSASSGAAAPAKVGATSATVATFSGDGGAPQDTGPFTVHGGAVRFVYSVQPNDVGPVPFLWSMFNQGAPINPASPRARDSCASCDGQQTDELGVVPPGSYYLHVITSRPWTLTVVEAAAGG
jgi:hypothetical protein